MVTPPRPIVLQLEPLHAFSGPPMDLAPQPVDRLLTAMRNGTGPVSRDEALSVAAVQRGRNELCSIGTIPLRLYRGTEVQNSPLFRQFDPDLPNVVHMSMTVEDLALEKIAWWRVTGQDFDGFPVAVRRVDPGRVRCKRPAGPERPGDDRFVWIRQDNGQYEQVATSLMIRFDSPNPGILKANARPVRIARALDDLVESYANNPALREYFTDTDNPEVDPMEDDEVEPWLSEYAAMRQSRPFVGWIPSTVKRVEAGTPSPKDLTLADLKSSVMVDLANGLGIDPEDIGVSTTSRTYQNEDARRRDKINRMYAPYMSAITDRLSMGDVTRYGYSVRFDLNDYLKPDPAGRVAYYQGMQELIGLKPEWIAAQEGIPVGAFNSTPAAPAPAGPVIPPTPVESARVAGRRFDGGPAFTFDARDFDGAAAAPVVDEAARTITGLAVPYNAVADKFGMKYKFLPGSLEYSSPDRMPHLQDHMTPVGFHRSIEDGAAGPVVALSVLSGPDGSPERMRRDQLLYDAQNGLYTGLSVGVDFSLDPEDGDVTIDDDGVINVQRATWRETSSTYLPAFDDARVTTVAASLTGGNMDPCKHCRQRHAPNIACATFARQLPAAQPAAAQPAAQPFSAQPLQPDQAAQFNAYTQWLATQQQQAQPAAQNAAPPAAAGPTAVNANHGAVQVTEPSPYRFDRTGNLRAGSHDFSSDLVLGWKAGDQAAQDRVQSFIERTFQERDFGHANPAVDQQFAITPANVTNLNYPQNRPDLYVDQLDYQYPMYAAVNKGTLDTVTPFVIPKFNSSSGLVADHVTGTEPTPGAFTATAQTLTPSAVSGKVEITREAFDQGGNPQMSGLIWRQMVRAWYEALEAFVQAQLVAAAASITDILITTAAADSTLDGLLADAIVPLQYIRGGDRFRTVFTQIDLYKAMVKAKDSTGRRLYPSIGAMNAVGSADPRYAWLEAHGKLWVPAWATQATGTVAASSWMFDPEVVCLWASAPQRIDLQWRVAWVDMGLFGYKAFGITDFTRTRELVYDPV